MHDIMLPCTLWGAVKGAANRVTRHYACVEWFKKASEKEKSRVNGSVFKVLVFNLTGDRKAEDTIAPLVSCHFDFVIFCPNFAHVSVSGSSDQIAVASTWEMQMERCTHNYNAWRQLVSSARSQKDETQTSEDYSRAAVFDSICGILKWLSQNRGSNLQTDSNDKHLCELLVAADQVQVLVTGSLLLVGGFLGLLDPELKGTSDNTDIGLKLAVSGSQHILNGIHANLMSTCCVPGTP